MKYFLKNQKENWKMDFTSMDQFGENLHLYNIKTYFINMVNLSAYLVIYNDFQGSFIIFIVFAIHV